MNARQVQLEEAKLRVDRFIGGDHRKRQLIIAVMSQVIEVKERRRDRVNTRELILSYLNDINSNNN